MLTSSSGLSGGCPECEAACAGDSGRRPYSGTKSHRSKASVAALETSPVRMMVRIGCAFISTLGNLYVISDRHVERDRRGGGRGYLDRGVEMEDRHAERILPDRHGSGELAASPRAVGEDRGRGKFAIGSGQAHLVTIQALHVKF